MGDTQLYLKHDVQRLIVVLLAFVAVPCALLVFLAYQSVRTMGESVIHQHREACLLQLHQIGKAAQHRLNNLLESSHENFKMLTPSQPAFWDEAITCLTVEQIVKTPLVLDSAGKLIIPHPRFALPPDLPRLSEIHPQQPTLTAARRAHWVAGDVARAITLYREVLDAQNVPDVVRASVWAEMAQSERQRSNNEAALADYEHMFTEVADNKTIAATNPPPLLAMLHAAELSRQFGRPGQLLSWVHRLLDECEEHWLDLDSEQLTLVADRLPTILPGGKSTEINRRLGRLGQLRRIRSAMTTFMRDHGTGPFQFQPLPAQVDSGDAKLTLSISEMSSDPESSYLLVETGVPLSDGSRLGFEIDLAEMRSSVLSPALLELMQVRGGSAELVNTPKHMASDVAHVDPAESISFQLPAPFEFWTLRYNIEPSPLLHATTTSQSRLQIALLVSAVMLVAIGLGVTFFLIHRSVHLAQLQTDVIERISHELKTPISTVAVLTDTLERDGETDASIRKQIVNLLHVETQSLVRLSERLLGYAHQRFGALRLKLTEDRLDHIVAELVRLFPVEVGVDASCFTLEIEPADYRGQFDRATIEEIGRNLLDNAVKYCEGPPRVRITLRRVDGECVLEVSDNGWGMDRRTRRLVFKPYFRADTSLSARVPGIGLGLSIVRNLVRAHSGTIAVHSILGQGSTFEVRLPLNQKSANHP